MSRLKLISFMIILTAACSCTCHRPDGSEIQTYGFSYSGKLLSVSLRLELPSGNDSVTQRIRESLIADFVRNSQRPLHSDGLTHGMEPFRGDRDDVHALAIQPLLREGLRRYYRDCGEILSDEELLARLFVKDDMIPLPVDTEYPNADGDSLTFSYQQYEIAPYADGMPSFRLPVAALTERQVLPLIFS